MVKFLKNLRLRTKVILIALATILLAAGIFLLYNYLEYARTASIPLPSFIPESAHAAAMVRNFGRNWKEVFQSPVLGVLVPAAKGKEQLGDCLAAVLVQADVEYAAYAEKVKKATAQVGEERVLSICGKEAFVAVELQPGDAPLRVLAGTRIGFTDFMGRFVLSSALAELTGEEPRSAVIGGGTFWRMKFSGKKAVPEETEWLVGIVGSVLFVCNNESFLRRGITAGLSGEAASARPVAKALSKPLPTGVIGRVALDFARTPPDWKWRAAVESFFESVPVREVFHFFRPEALDSVSADINLAKDDCQVKVSVFLQPGRLSERQTKLLSEQTVEPLKSPALVPERAFMCVASRFNPSDSWDFITQTVRDRARGSVPRQAGDIMKAIFAEADRILFAPLEKSGKHVDLMDALGGEALVAASREKVADRAEERVSIGLSAIVAVTNEQKVLSILDRVETWNISGSQGKPQLVKENHRGVEVRLLRIAFQKYGRGFTPSYAVANGWLVFSSSLSFVQDVIDCVFDGRGPGSSALVQFDSISRERASGGFECALIDFRALRETLTDARGSIAEVSSDNVDRVAVRAEVVKREEEALEPAAQHELVAEWRQYRDALAAGRYRAPSKALQPLLEKADRLVMERVEDERRMAEQSVLDLVHSLAPLKALSLSVKPSKDGFTLMVTVPGKSAGKRN